MLDRFFPDSVGTERRERTKLLAMAGLYFLVLFAVGILRPIRNALALDGLGDTRFYQVYLVSGVVIFAVPPYNRLADRIPWRTLIPSTAAFFAIGLLVLRLLYTEGSTAFGMTFYGYYDLFAASLVTQFFMSVQVFFNARYAKSAIPLVIMGGSLGATFGGFTTGGLAKVVGTPNLMLLAAAFIAAFAVALPFVWAGAPVVKPRAREATRHGYSTAEFFEIFSHRHIRLIAALVLITVVVKTMVDYEFNEITKLYLGNRDAVASFQGLVQGWTNWLPILVLATLGPILKRWGVGVAVLILPVVMFFTSLGLALAFGLWVAVAAKASDSAFRYSAERTAREILYVPVPTDLKLRAKAYVDMALEKGLGKVLSALVIFLLLQRMGLRGIPWVIAGLSIIWMVGALAVRREYLATLAESIKGRFASIEGSFATLTERSTLAFVEDALRGDPVQVAFALDLVEQAGRVDAEPIADEMELLLGHEEPALRARVLRLLARFPGLVPEDRIRASLSDSSETVRQAAVVALAAAAPDSDGRAGVLRELLEVPEPGVRHATLTALVRGQVSCDRSAVVGREYVLAQVATLGGIPTSRERSPATVAVGAASGGDEPFSAPPEAREELALALGLVTGEDPVPGLLERLLQDDDPRVTRAALLSAGLLGRGALYPEMLAALAVPELREEAREALMAQGLDVVDTLKDRLVDPDGNPAVRRQIPAVMARIPGQRTVGALLAALAGPPDDRVLDLRILEALEKLREHPSDGDALEFDAVLVLPVARKEAERASRYSMLHTDLERGPRDEAGIRLLLRALDEAWEDCRQSVFRCLGLLFSPGEMRQAHFIVKGGDERARANGVEWLEETMGHELFVQLEPALVRKDGRGGKGTPAGLEEMCGELAADRDGWLSELATWNMGTCRGQDRVEGSETMDRIEKVFLLQKVDLLQEAKSSHLALLASIAEEVDVSEGEEIIRQGTANESLYVVIRGSVELQGMGDQHVVAKENTAFGTWALIDSDPSVVGARAAESSRLLRITRGDFQDLLADQPELAMGMLQGLARRLRALVA